MLFVSQMSLLLKIANRVFSALVPFKICMWSISCSIQVVNGQIKTNSSQDGTPFTEANLYVA